MDKAKEKILLLLFGGLALGFCYTPNQQRRIFKMVSREWNKLSKNELRNGINYLYRLKYVDEIPEGNDFTAITLTKKGKLKALNYRLNNLRSKKGRWDGKWRMVAFDIPEKFRKGRDALRQKLQKIGFCELQKSVLITPYECKAEITELVAFFELEKYIRFGILEEIDNVNYFKKYFNL